MSAPSSHARSPLRLALWRSAPFILFGLLLWFVDVRELWGALEQLTIPMLGALLGVSVALIWVSALKWGMFIRELGGAVSTAKLFALYLLGYFVNLILPSYLGGDAVRSWHVGKDVGQHEAAAATILERYTGLVAMVALALIFVWFERLASWPMVLGVIVVAVGVVAVTAIAMSDRLFVFFRRYPQLESVMKHLERVRDALKLASSKRGLLLRALLLSLVYHSLTVVNTLVCGWAVGWDSPPVIELFVVLPLILLVGALPVSPQGLGVQEGAFFFFLHGIGATPAQALGIPLILRAKSYILAMLGGIVWLMLRRPRDSSVEPTGAIN